QPPAALGLAQGRSTGQGRRELVCEGDARLRYPLFVRTRQHPGGVAARAHDLYAGAPRCTRPGRVVGAVRGIGCSFRAMIRRNSEVNLNSGELIFMCLQAAMVRTFAEAVHITSQPALVACAAVLAPRPTS